MKYTIGKVEEKTFASGAVCKKAELNGDKVYHNVTFWKKSWTNSWDSIRDGGEIEATLKEEQKGQYTNITAFPPMPNYTPRVKTDMVKVMEKKEKSIEKFQDNKETSIRTASTFRAAVDIMVARMAKGDYSDDDIEEGIKGWRHTLWKMWEYDMTEEPPFEG